MNNEKESTIFLRLPPSHQLSLAQENINKLHIPNNINLCFEYTTEIRNDTKGGTIASIHAAINNGSRKSIGIFNPTYHNDEDPISVASEVADLIDTMGGRSYIILASTTGNNIHHW